jgi:hypothetical protein
VSDFFGWIAPTINAVYTTRQLYSFNENIPVSKNFIVDINNASLIDFNNDHIIF